MFTIVRMRSIGHIMAVTEVKASVYEVVDHVDPRVQRLSGREEKPSVVAGEADRRGDLVGTETCAGAQCHRDWGS
jgi:hypothetical protein